MSEKDNRSDHTDVNKHTECIPHIHSVNVAVDLVFWVGSLMMRHRVDMVLMTLGSGHLRPLRTLKMVCRCDRCMNTQADSQTWSHICACKQNKRRTERESVLYVINPICRRCRWQPLQRWWHCMRVCVHMCAIQRPDVLYMYTYLCEVTVSPLGFVEPAFIQLWVIVSQHLLMAGLVILGRPLTLLHYSIDLNLCPFLCSLPLILPLFLSVAVWPNLSSSLSFLFACFTRNCFSVCSVAHQCNAVSVWQQADVDMFIVWMWASHCWKRAVMFRLPCLSV